MARQKSLSTATAADRVAGRTLILDNGAHTIKAGFCSGSTADPNPSTDCHLIHNSVARSHRDKRTYVGPELEECADFGELAFRRPVEKGYTVNWESEKAIWERSFFDSNAVLRCDPQETNLILTEAPNAPAVLQKNADEIVFEEFGFASYYRTIGPLVYTVCSTTVPVADCSSTGTQRVCSITVPIYCRFTVWDTT